MKKKFIVFIIGLCIVFNFSCSYNYFLQGEPEWDFPENLKDSYLIPVGRKTNSDIGLEIIADNSKSDFSIYTDHAMGNWIVISRNSGISNIKIILKNNTYSIAARPVDKEKDHAWIQPSSLIDSNNSDIKNIAEELMKQNKTNDSIASAVQNYVRENIMHKESYRSFSKKASETLKLKRGICINRSRLFTAICRASGVPARTVWGYFYLPPMANQEGHHEWAEYLNDNNQWVQLDFDERLYKYHRIFKPYIGHVDLLYAAEENPVFLSAKDFGSTVLFISKDGSWLKGRFGYKVIEFKYPVSLTIENNFNIK